MTNNILIDERNDPWNPSTDIVRLFLMKGAFPEGQVIRTGMSNHCTRKGFHPYIDCDDAKLTDILDYLETQDMGYWYILGSSPHHFSLLNFSRVSWKRYKRILGTCPLVHTGYVYCTVKKGYGVLRIGAKDGIVPRLLYRYGSDNGKECRVCRDFFFSNLEGFTKMLPLKILDI